MEPILVIKTIRFAEIIGAPNAAALFAEYAAECSIPEIGPINPQADIYERLEAAGAMQCFGAFAGETLIGFACVLETVNPHYGKKLATLESLFVTQEHRKTGSGTQLMEAVEKHAYEAQCAGILYSAPVSSQLAKLLTVKGYRRTNLVFYRGLQ